MNEIGRRPDIEVSVGLFPGQGAYVPGGLEWLRVSGSAAAAIDEVDATARALLGRSVVEAVGGPNPPDVDTLLAQSPDILQVAVFAAAVGTFEALREHGASPSVLVGHSLGEIAALVAGGALDVATGAEILCHRITLLREHDTSGGGLVALSCGSEQVEQVLALLPGSGAAVAVDNGPGQTVVSGSADTLRRVAAIAAAIGTPATVLRAAHPFHNEALRGSAQALAARIAGTRSRGLTTPVYSPVLGRYYRDTDDIAALLASHLVTPVRFGPTVERLRAAGAAVWVECGAGEALTGIVGRRYPDATLLAPLTRRGESIATTAAFLGSTPVPPARAAAPATVPVVATVPAPAAVPTPTPTPTPAPAIAPAATVDREAIAQRLRALYAEALEYPPEVFEDTAVLEADLGVDSVKQTELLARVSEQFGLGPRPEALRMSDYATFGSVIDFVGSSSPARAV